MAKGDTEDISAAAQVTDWLAKGLPSVLPKGVEPNLSKLALAGHSRGGHTAFSLALGHGKTNLKFSALIGLDPVAGQGKFLQISPKILTYEPSSFDIAMPVLVIGTGPGEEKRNILFPPLCPQRCEPQGVLPRVQATLLLLCHQGLWASGHARRRCSQVHDLHVQGREKLQGHDEEERCRDHGCILEGRAQWRRW